MRSLAPRALRSLSGATGTTTTVGLPLVPFLRGSCRSFTSFRAAAHPACFGLAAAPARAQAAFSPLSRGTRRGAATGSDSTAEEAAKKEEAAGSDKKEAEEDDKGSKEEVEADAKADKAAEDKKEKPPEPELTEEETAVKEVDELEAKLKTKKHELLLQLAEFENNKKRFSKERLSRRKSATVTFARKVIEVHDEFTSLINETGGEVPESCQALHEGITLTGDIYRQAFERYDIRAIAPELGSPFVQAQHEDAGSVKNGELPARSIAEVVSPGWLLEGSPPTVLRMATVKLASE